MNVWYNYCNNKRQKSCIQEEMKMDESSRTLYPINKMIKEMVKCFIWVFITWIFAVVCFFEEIDNGTGVYLIIGISLIVLSTVAFIGACIAEVVKSITCKKAFISDEGIIYGREKISGELIPWDKIVQVRGSDKGDLIIQTNIPLEKSPEETKQYLIPCRNSGEFSAACYNMIQNQEQDTESKQEETEQA